jgi:hypothetical protein
MAPAGHVDQSVNRPGAKKLVMNQIAAKRLMSRLVRVRLTRGSQVGTSASVAYRTEEDDGAGSLGPVLWKNSGEEVTSM